MGKSGTRLALLGVFRQNVNLRWYEAKTRHPEDLPCVPTHVTHGIGTADDGVPIQMGFVHRKTLQSYRFLGLMAAQGEQIRVLEQMHIARVVPGVVPTGMFVDELQFVVDYEHDEEEVLQELRIELMKYAYPDGTLKHKLEMSSDACHLTAKPPRPCPANLPELTPPKWEHVYEERDGVPVSWEPLAVDEVARTEHHAVGVREGNRRPGVHGW